jgi:hypothetical protein
MVVSIWLAQSVVHKRRQTVKSGPGLQTTPALQVLGIIGVVSSIFIVSVVDIIASALERIKPLLYFTPENKGHSYTYILSFPSGYLCSRSTGIRS